MSEEKGKGVSFHFVKPGDTPPKVLSQIHDLIKEGGAVGLSFVRENLRKAFLIGYAEGPGGRVIGTVVLKHQRDSYRKKIEIETGLNLSGYLERGYTSVAPDWRGYGIGDALIRGLTREAGEQKIYVTIHMDNAPALQLTRKNGMMLAGKFFNQRTGREIGVFVNR